MWDLGRIQSRGFRRLLRQPEARGSGIWAQLSARPRSAPPSATPGSVAFHLRLRRCPPEHGRRARREARRRRGGARGSPRRGGGLAPGRVPRLARRAAAAQARRQSEGTARRPPLLAGLPYCCGPRSPRHGEGGVARRAGRKGEGWRGESESAMGGRRRNPGKRNFSLRPRASYCIPPAAGNCT